MKKVLLIFIIFFIMGFIVVGINLYNKNKKISEISQLENILEESNYIEKETVKTSNKEEVKISPNAELVFIEKYLKCGHEKSRKEYVSSEMVNMTRESFEEMYSDWTIEEFSSNKIILSKEFKAECKEHFVVKEIEDKINIYRIIEDGDLELYVTTEINTIYLGEEERKELKEGVPIYGKTNLNAYIENFE